MPFDGITIAAVVRELDVQLAGSRIERVHQPEREVLVLSVRGHGASHRLVISANPRWNRLHVTTQRLPNPQRPPLFCTVLRKHLEGGRLQAVTQDGWERVVRFRVQAMNDFMEWQERELVCEFTGKHANIILVDPATGLIVDAMKRYGDSAGYREVAPGHPYVGPPPQDKLDVTAADEVELARRVWNCPDATLARALFTACAGFSPFAARQACLLAGIDPDTESGQCGAWEMSAVLAQCRRMAEQARSGTARGVVVCRGGEAVDFAAYPVQPESTDVSVCERESAGEAVAFFFTRALARMQMESTRANLLRRLRQDQARLQRRSDLLREDLAQAAEGARWRTWGELLTAYAHRVPRGAEAVELEDFVDGSPLLIPLLPHLSVIDNAQRYFRLYAKARAALEHAASRLAATEAELAYLQSVATMAEQADSAEEFEEILLELEREGYVKTGGKTRRAGTGSPRPPRRFFSSNGTEILVGRNNLGNDRLTLRLAREGDLWLHASGIPGAHVILRLDSNAASMDAVPDADLEEAALLAAYFSQGRSGGKVSVDYTFRRSVRKPAGARPGMVVYDPYWSLLVDTSDARLARLLAQEDSAPA